MSSLWSNTWVISNFNFKGLYFRDLSLSRNKMTCFWQLKHMIVFKTKATYLVISYFSVYCKAHMHFTTVVSARGSYVNDLFCLLPCDPLLNTHTYIQWSCHQTCFCLCISSRHWTPSFLQYAQNFQAASTLLNFMPSWGTQLGVTFTTFEPTFDRSSIRSCSLHSEPGIICLSPWP